MTASRFSPLHSTVALTLLLIFGTTMTGCAAPHRDRTTSDVVISGELLADGSCRALVRGAALFAATDHPRTTYDAGPVADVAPTGYALHQLTCAPSGTDPARNSGGDVTDETSAERMVIIAVYTPEGAPLRVGRYTIREALATPGDTADVATRAGIAVFGAPPGSRAGNGDAHAGAGVRYLEGRRGTLTISRVTRDADGEHVAGSFSARASPAWSM